jgi:5-methylcytosine-specific restriction enzyme subunit McrC
MAEEKADNLAVGNLLGHYRILQKLGTHVIPSTSLIDILAKSLISGMGEIEQYGLYKEYISKTVDTSFPRGRIMMGATMQRHLARGRSHSVTASWFEHSANNAPNRCLKYAIWLLSQRYKSVTMQKGQRKIVSDLNRIYHLFENTSLDRSKSFLKDKIVGDPSRMPVLRSYYSPLLHLATTIIENKGISFNEKGSDMLLPSMIFDFDVVFEKYLRKVLQADLEQLDPTLRVLDGTIAGAGSGSKLLFDTSVHKVRANPDIVVRRKDEAETEKLYPVILDAKYKPVDFPDRSDINQAIGYGYSYRCKNTVLAHPKRENGRSGLHTIGNIGEYNFYQYIFDMDCEKPEEEEERFVKAVQSLTAPNDLLP